jgi:hypothetical protein
MPPGRTIRQRVEQGISLRPAILSGYPWMEGEDVRSEKPERSPPRNSSGDTAEISRGSRSKCLRFDVTMIAALHFTASRCPKECVAQGERKEDAGVENGDRVPGGHPSPLPFLPDLGVAAAKPLGETGELPQGGLSVLVAAGLVHEHVAHAEPPVPPGHPKRQRSVPWDELLLPFAARERTGRHRRGRGALLRGLLRQAASRPHSPRTPRTGSHCGLKTVTDVSGCTPRETRHRCSGSTGVQTGYIGNGQTRDMGNSRTPCPGHRPIR